MSQEVSHRNQHLRAALSEHELPSDPLILFGAWLSDAEREGALEHNAMALSTIGTTGPRSRMVLLRSFSDKGFVFYTNYNSRKAGELDADPRAALLFFWPLLERQVRAEGSMTRVDASESDTYFRTRPRGSQIGAWASDQSERIADRMSLDERYARWEKRFEGADIPRPAHWGGMCVSVLKLEFWQGRGDRMHDRIAYTRGEGAAWMRERLQP